MHPTAIEVRSEFPKEWQEYWKFCFVRNPWDRVVSEYHWANAESRGVAFDDFVQRLANADLEDPEQVRPVPADNWSMLAIDGKIVADFIGRFENLAHDMKEVCHRLQIPFDSQRFPKLKTSKRGSYRPYYSEHTRKLIEQRYWQEISHFGYCF